MDRSIFRVTDYRTMPLAFVDLFAADGVDERSMEVLGREDFNLLTDSELRAETDKFVEAYLRVRAEAGRDKEERTTSGVPLFLDYPPA